MGQTISSLLDKLGFGVKEHKVLFLGLDNAGKTTMLYNFRIGEVIDTVPTIGETCCGTHKRRARRVASVCKQTSRAWLPAVRYNHRVQC